MTANRVRGDEELRRIVEGLAVSVAAINDRLPLLAVQEELVIGDPAGDDDINMIENRVLAHSGPSLLNFFHVVQHL